MTETSTRPADALDAIREKRDEAGEKIKDSSTVEGLARAGLVARGLLYAGVGALAIEVARGRARDPADKQGALEAASHQPLGRVVLVGVGVGFAGYALWRFVQAVLLPADDDGKVSRWAKRVGQFARGLLYSVFFFSTIPFMVGSGTEGDRNREADVTATALRWPVGRPLVAAIGLGIVGVGLYNGYRALSTNYRKQLDNQQMSRATSRAITWVATLGLAARMVVFTLVGGFITKAAIRYDPTEAVGLDGALHRLANRAYGPWMLGIVAVGLFAFGAYSLAEARYRDVLDA